MKIDSRLLRDAFGKFATGVCVVTANPPGYKPFGMTINSYTSVSLEPPILLWSLQKSSDCLTAFEAASQFAINVLDMDQREISNRYSRKGNHDLHEGDYRVGRSGCAMLKGALSNFECNVRNRVDAGDHIVILGDIVEVTVRPTGKPLVFYSSQYRELK